MINEKAEGFEHGKDCSTIDDFLEEATALGPMTEKECDDVVRPQNSGTDIMGIDREIFEVALSSISKKLRNT